MPNNIFPPSLEQTIQDLQHRVKQLETQPALNAGVVGSGSRVTARIFEKFRLNRHARNAAKTEGRVGLSTGVIGGIVVADDGIIQSHNFDGDVTTGDPGTQGFAVGGPDGSAAFNDITMRGQLEMAPITQGGPGNIWWNDDAVNNAAIYEDTGLHALIMRGQFPTGPNAQITIWPPSFSDGSVAIGGWGSVVGTGPYAGNATLTQLTAEGISATPVDLAAGTFFGTIPTGGLITIGTQLPTNDTVRTQFGANAPRGQYYFEDYTIQAGATFPNNTLTPAIGSVGGFPLVLQQSNSDYGSLMNQATGVWTCPEDSIYDLTGVVFFNLSLASPGARLILAFIDGAGNRILLRDTMSMGFNDTISGKVWISAGASVTFEIDQISGASRTISSAAGLRSYVTFKRDL